MSQNGENQENEENTEKENTNLQEDSPPSSKKRPHPDDEPIIPEPLSKKPRLDTAFTLDDNLRNQMQTSYKPDFATTSAIAFPEEQQFYDDTMFQIRSIEAFPYSNLFEKVDDILIITPQFLRNDMDETLVADGIDQNDMELITKRMKQFLHTRHQDLSHRLLQFANKLRWREFQKCQQKTGVK